MKDNNILKEKVKSKIAISKFREENIAMKKNLFFNKKMALVASFIIVILTSVVFAENIQNFITEKFYFGEGLETAIENGYIANSEMDFSYSDVTVKNAVDDEILDNFKVGIKVNNYLMNDNQITIDFEIQFDEKIKKYINFDKQDYENFGSIVFTDLAILDNENKLILFKGNENKFYNICENYSLDYKYQEFNENYLNTSSNSLVTEINSEANSLKLTCVFGNINNMPNSKELILSFDEITFTPKLAENNENDVILTGNWNFNLELPEYMYNRESILYKVTNCENENFDVYKAELTDTGFEIGLLISNIEKPTMPEKLSQKEAEIMENNPTGYSINNRDDFLQLYGEEFEEMYIDYWNKMFPVRIKNFVGVSWINGTEGCYILNSDGKKFEVSSSMYKPSHISDFIEGNKYDYSETFDMTKYDATSKITVIIDFYGTPVKIEMEQM